MEGYRAWICGLSSLHLTRLSHHLIKLSHPTIFPIPKLSLPTVVTSQSQHHPTREKQSIAKINWHYGNQAEPIKVQKSPKCMVNSSTLWAKWQGWHHLTWMLAFTGIGPTPSQSLATASSSLTGFLKCPCHHCNIIIRHTLPDLALSHSNHSNSPGSAFIQRQAFSNWQDGHPGRKSSFT